MEQDSSTPVAEPAAAALVAAPEAAAEQSEVAAEPVAAEPVQQAVPETVAETRTSSVQPAAPAVETPATETTTETPSAVHAAEPVAPAGEAPVATTASAPLPDKDESPESLAPAALTTTTASLPSLPPAASLSDAQASASAAPTAASPPPACAGLPTDSEYELPESVRSVISSVSAMLASPASVKADIEALTGHEAERNAASAEAEAAALRAEEAAQAAVRVPCVEAVATVYLDALAMPQANPLGLGDALGDAVEALQKLPNKKGGPAHPGLPVAYEMVGNWEACAEAEACTTVVLIPGEHDGGEVLRPLAVALARRCRAVRCLLFDRPNCGRSGLTWEGSASEAHMQSDYLHALLSIQLKLSQPVVLYGRGIGGRVALLHALRHPGSVGALLLENVPAGRKAALVLSRSHYTHLVDTASIYNKDGMSYVAREPRFAGVVASSDANRQHLLQTPYNFFKLRMARPGTLHAARICPLTPRPRPPAPPVPSQDTWAAPLSAGGDAAFFPALGIEQHRVHSIAAPVLCAFLPQGDGAESGTASAALMASLNDCFAGAVASTAAVALGCEQSVWEESAVAFLSALPQPLPAAPLRHAAAAAASTLAGATRSWARSVFGAASSDDTPASHLAPKAEEAPLDKAPGANLEPATSMEPPSAPSPARNCSSAALSEFMASAGSASPIASLAAAVGLDPDVADPAADKAQARSEGTDKPAAAKCTVQ